MPILILSSRHFKSADRCKQFLQYVVLNKLEGHTERLKERTIGTDVFQRPPGYATGEDPVVRVQAGEVRRRLELYYQETPQPSRVRIELPVGSYSPVFHWGTASAVKDVKTQPAPAVPVSASRWKSRLVLFSLALVAIAAMFVAKPLYNVFRRPAVSKNALERVLESRLCHASTRPHLSCQAGGLPSI